MKLSRNIILAYAASLPVVAAATDLNQRADSKLRGSDKKSIGGALEEDVAFWTNFQRNLQGMSLPYGNGPPSGGGDVRPPSSPEGAGDGARPTPFPTMMGSTLPASSFPTLAGSSAGTSAGTSAGSSAGTSAGTSSFSSAPPASGGMSSVQSTFPTIGAGAGITTTFPTAGVNAAGASSFPTSNFNGAASTSSFPTSNVAASAFPTAGLQATTASVGFVCPEASFVGCTAPDPLNPTDECPTVGQPCEGGNPGEFCCQDACPRNYCTAKGAPPAK